MSETAKKAQAEVLPHSIQISEKGAKRRAELMKNFYETTSYDKLPTDFMRQTEAGSDDDD